MEQFTKEKTTKNEDVQRHHCVFTLCVLGEAWREFGFGLAVLVLFLPISCLELPRAFCGQVSAHPQPNLNALTRQVGEHQVPAAVDKKGGKQSSPECS